MYWKKWIAFASLIQVAKIWGLGVQSEEMDQELPWFTGPLLTPSAEVVKGGHYNLEPYLYVLNSSGSKWTINPAIQVQIGILSWLDFQAFPGFQYTHVSNAGSWEMQDLPLQFDFQLVGASGMIPSIRFTIQEIFPIGKYRNLNPQKLGVDQGGMGSWNTVFQFVFGNLIQLSDRRFANWRLAFAGSLPAPVYVTGFNAYGGGYGANGTVYPGNEFFCLFGLEINFTDNWAFAIDLSSEWTLKNRFSGVLGIDAFGNIAKNISPFNAIYSIAPAIEYNWNNSLGVIGGWWGSIATVHANPFSGFVFALNYYK